MLWLQDILSRQQTDLCRVQGPATVLAPPHSALVRQSPSSPPEKQGRPRSGGGTRGRLITWRGWNNHFGSREDSQSPPSAPAPVPAWQGQGVLEREVRRTKIIISLNVRVSNKLKQKVRPLSPPLPTSPSRSGLTITHFAGFSSETLETAMQNKNR